jgi:hypothetical protein
MVESPEQAELQVISLGARRIGTAPSGALVFEDPAGHPFCLINRPSWSAPIG